MIWSRFNRKPIFAASHQLLPFFPCFPLFSSEAREANILPQLPLFNPSSLLFALSISLPTQIGDGGYCDLNALPCWRASAVLAPAFSPSLPPSLLVSLSPEGIAGAAAAAARFPPVSTTPVSARLCPGLPLLFPPLSSSPSLPRASHGRRWRPISLRSAPLHGRWSLFGSAQQIGGQSACLRILLVHVYLVLTYLRFSFQGHRTTKIIKKLEPTCYILAACKRNNDFLVLWIVLEDIDFRYTNFHSNQKIFLVR